MKELINRLVSVKSIVTFALIGATAYLAAAQRIQISPEFFASVVTAVVTYYFTRKDEKE